MENKNNYLIPASIVVAGVIIAGAMFVANRPNNPDSGGFPQQTTTPTGGTDIQATLNKIKAVTQADHILGDPNAPVKVVEFSDTECPFCKRFHATMHQLMAEYGTEGKVAWVYRHFPLDQLHPKARKEAEATECANELGGNEKFWAFVDKLYEITPSNNQLDPAQLPQIAVDVGLDRAQFESCLASGKYAQVVADNLQDAINSGGLGTPYSVVIAANGKKSTIEGAYPYEDVKLIIDLALQEK